ncbi:MAG: UDP-N-acetylmuramate:L-alanyl-gamma-D-glutamyl-meso-diaminopimelate ligase [Nitrosomonadales bacterium]|jgi:UDP-N-acetylmuramate: L-alanyl-gamma-D-glutamyl-meso-diaminopimelate ligase|nr:UDP-N-acetylmuramate:L-alanyl-gamma-D-glutamyl-meso-diaminopimelate ligase [Nitrosomonadales bacterium]MCH9771398.1 UDP-N-acetylmuramate:L-alanyl-gamma-D-glutamyl-meso-diaminopimelate ligase [Betaproteobacteria bacterium]
MHIHILGICGTFMAGLASLAKSKGFKVTGCDQNVYPPMSTQLEEEGIKIIEGFDSSQTKLKPDIYIIGNVVKRGTPLMESILNNNLSFMSGPQWLYENILHEKWVIAVAGTHGKTSTTAMVAWILEFCGLNPSYLIGGIPKNLKTSSRLINDKNSNFFIIEADEYDTAFFDKRSKFVHYYPRTLIMNNLEFDHADIFENLNHIKKHFHHLIRIVPEKGKIISNAQSNALNEVIKLGVWSDLEYFNDIDGWSYQWQDESSSLNIFYQNKKEGTLTWECIGDHNASNALAAIAAAHHIGIPAAKSIKALATFKGVKRRLEKIGEFKDNIKIYDDFAHHPSAIKSTLDGMRQVLKEGRIIVVFEPRSNTMKLGEMKKELQDSLSSADIVYCYASNLDWDPNELFKNNQKIKVSDSTQWILSSIIKEKKPNDQIVFMSNGSFSGIQNKCLDLFKNE